MAYALQSGRPHRASGELARHVIDITLGIFESARTERHVPITMRAERVFPGEGMAPTHTFAGLLHRAGYQGYLSLELFIEDYHGQTALEVAQHGLVAMQTAYTIEG